MFAYRFFCADFLAKAVCLICFLLLPTTNIRPSVEGDGLWEGLVRFLYQVDAPVNLRQFSMKIGQAFKMALRSIGAKKGRTALTMLGIIIGV